DGDGAFEFPDALQQQIGDGGAELTIGVRPESVRVAHEAAEGYTPVEAHIIEPLGAYDIIDLKLGRQTFRARTPSGFVPRPGVRVWAKLDAGQTHFFDARSGGALNVRLSG
ncbi:MAG TPA: TOBE domain-containing protein, partial [Dongiaceae bacterium]